MSSSLNTTESGADILYGASEEKLSDLEEKKSEPGDWQGITK